MPITRSQTRSQRNLNTINTENVVKKIDRRKTCQNSTQSNNTGKSSHKHPEDAQPSLTKTPSTTSQPVASTATATAAAASTSTIAASPKDLLHPDKILITTPSPKIIHLLDLLKNNSPVNLLIKYFKENFNNINIVKVIRVQRKLVIGTSKQRFLLSCRNRDIIPNHLLKLTRNLFFHNQKSIHKFNILINNLARRVLNMEIDDIHTHIQSLHKQKHFLLENIKHITNDCVASALFVYLNDSFEKQKTQLDHKHNKKINGFHGKRNLIDNHNNNNTDQNNNHHNNRSSDTTHTREKWLINLTNHNIPQYVKDTLCLGEKFNFSIQFKSKHAFEFFKHLETNLYFTKTQIIRLGTTSFTLLILTLKINHTLVIQTK